MKRHTLGLILLVAATGAMAQTYVPQVYPQQQTLVGEARLAVRDSVFTLSNEVLEASFTCQDGSLRFGGCEALGLRAGTELFSFTLGSAGTLTKACSELLLDTLYTEDLTGSPTATRGAEHFDGKALVARFIYGTSLEVTWRAVLRDGSHYLRTEMHLRALRNIRMHHIVAMQYQVEGDTPKVSGNTRGSVLASQRLFAGLETPMGINETASQDDGSTLITGTWSRNVLLEAGRSWTVSSVVGLMGERQQRRSFLAYSERERAVPWRPMPVYISWYELNIDRNNDPDYTTNMNISQCVDVMKQWKTHLSDAYQTDVKAFVWDDGWDHYGTWTFNPNFPNGFQEADDVARQMGSGIGAWLGPVGGYGQSGNYRRQYWADKGGVQLSNPAYYQTFWDACKYMVEHYDFRFFKFDGISAQFSATGPDSGTTGEENAEAIIDMESQIRQQLRPDIFFNTTVGTWASPFWFHFTDAVWRQEQDYGTIGNNTIDRENWITYRDRLVYQNFVQNAPLCPINTLMTHGFILSSHGNVSQNRTYQAVLREMRCAFACGSGMVELYNDYSLMNSINGGKLWADLAECIQWQREQADVLPDIHWVGGNPWDGSKANIYGWAAWNGLKSVVTLRNGSNSAQRFTTTLRQMLDIPASVTGSITLSKAFRVQTSLSGLTEGTPIDIDQTLSLLLPASSVYVFNGIDSERTAVEGPQDGPTTTVRTSRIYDLSGRPVAEPQRGVYIQNGTKILRKD
ncbi:MAG: hypothetical protein IJ197_02550 [Bacteroidaceae bacterium]|nr:hypothetical protein [Bacteroidaceae bacterium]